MVGLNEATSGDPPIGRDREAGGLLEQKAAAVQVRGRRQRARQADRIILGERRVAGLAEQSGGGASHERRAEGLRLRPHGSAVQLHSTGQAAASIGCERDEQTRGRTQQCEGCGWWQRQSPGDPAFIGPGSRPPLVIAGGRIAGSADDDLAGLRIERRIAGGGDHGALAHSPRGADADPEMGGAFRPSPRAAAG